MENLTAYDLVRTVHQFAQDLPIKDNRLVCMACGHKVLINDLNTDQTLCGTLITKNERCKIISNTKWTNDEQKLLIKWFGVLG